MSRSYSSEASRTIRCMCRDAARALPILAYCLIPNHVHLVVRPTFGYRSCRSAHWLFTSHARRYHWRSTNSARTSGRDVFKTLRFNRSSSAHSSAIRRANPLAAKLVARAEDWRSSSLRWLAVACDLASRTVPHDGRVTTRLRNQPPRRHVAACARVSIDNGRSARRSG